MAQELRPDICVIGAGAGSLATAAAAAAFNVPVVLIEPAPGEGSRDGGRLMASALLAATARIQAARSAARFGLQSPRGGVDFAVVKEQVRQVVAAVAPNESRERMTGLGVRVIEGAARFVNRHTVAVGDLAITARRFVIATGSSPALPPIPGLAETPHLTGDTILDLADCPRHLIVIGAGSAGLEMAQAFRRLGADVTVLEAATPLAGEDAEGAAVVLDALQRDGVTLRSGVEIAGVHRVLASVEVDIVARSGIEPLRGSHLFVAAGRRPNIESLDLEAARIRYGPRGIVVDRRLRTSNKCVYAIGDAAAGPKLPQVAAYHAELVIRQALFRQRVKVDTAAVPTVTHTDPELAQVGLLEDGARAAAGAIRVLRWPYRENERAQCTQATNGHIKVITDRHGGILGVTIVGPEAGETITPWALAMAQKLNIRALAGLIVPFPAYAEVGKRAAMTYFMRGLTSSQVRRIIGWLRRLG
jgi:pyruvate/2-oxoglutarate dehydrogenase complex dihydrolipoamide dehydrogenase (E3) component